MYCRNYNGTNISFHSCGSMIDISEVMKMSFMGFPDGCMESKSEVGKC